MTSSNGAELRPAREFAHELRQAGISSIPIRSGGSKQPALTSWKEFQENIPTEEQINNMFRGSCGIAVVGGKVSGNLETMDVDAPELVEPYEALVEELSPGLIARLSVAATPRGNYGGRHYRYRTQGIVAGNTTLAQSELQPKFKKDGTPEIDERTGDQKWAPKTLIETRGEGGYSLAPGSPGLCHETGLPYKHLSGPPLTEVPTITPEEHTALWTAAAAFNRFVEDSEVQSGGKAAGEGLSPGNDFNNRATWEEVLGAAGWEKDRTRGELTFWRRPGKDRGQSATTGVKSKQNKTELFCVFSSNAYPFTGPSGGRKCTSYSKFAAYAVLNHNGDFSAAAKDLAAKGYGEKRKPNSAQSKPAKKKLCPPKPFRPFPVEALPEPLRTFVVSGAKAIGCDTSFIALPLLTVVGAAIGNSRRLLAKKGWVVPPILWTAIVGESGTAKSPAFKLAVKAMRQRQRKALKRQEEEERRFESELAVFDKKYSEWKRSKSRDEEPPKKPEPPQPERCIVSDTTVEALAPILKANPRGLLLARDELNGWLGSFDRYAGGKGGADSSHWLSMYNGETIIVDRRTGQPRTIYVPLAAMGVTGGIQPGILHKALGHEHRESGLCARLLLSCPPRKAKSWTEDEIDPQVESGVARLLDWLYDLRPAIDDDEQVQPVVIGMKADARAAFRQFFVSHAEELADLSGELAAAFNKLEEVACRLALVIHYARWAAGDESITQDSPLDLQSMEAGIVLCEWFKAETVRVYSILEESPEVREQRRLVEWIEGRGGAVTARDLAHGPRSFRGQPDAAESALNELVNAEIGTWEFLPPGDQGGRPTRLFRLNPAWRGTETPAVPGKSEGFGSGANGNETKSAASEGEQEDEEWTG